MTAARNHDDTTWLGLGDIDRRIRNHLDVCALLREHRLRPWGVGNVVQHPVKVGEGRFDDGQLRIERAWPDA